MVVIILNISAFSSKQLLTLKWWNIKKYSSYDAIICDGAIRSGKTLSMSIGFVMWAMANFKNGSFALCGKTVTSLRRNVISPLLDMLRSVNFDCSEKVSKNYFDISICDITNRFYLFGGKDEGSSALIQGITLCGVFFDEVVLMPRSFVEQSIARCSVTKSKLWFNCNPDNPYHWFYREWILKVKEKNALYVHFTMEDNPSLSSKIKDRYKRLYSGTFYDRFVLGKWTASSGVVYPMFNQSHHVVENTPINCTRYVISCDYGTINPASFGLWGLSDGVWFRIDEYYYSSKEHGSLRTDEEYYSSLEELAGNLDIENVIVDPSASSFIECIKRHNRFNVIKANNDVISGIRRVSDALQQDLILFSNRCKDTIREFSLYCWNEKLNNDTPLKENDHAMDDIRYFVSYALQSNSEDYFFCSSLLRE